ncbi:hypothetical protein [Photobacterium swingsii]|uniref:hypothetical protein n=1 Tax=Photobacterium swingsii TaxID=680026 RepID=UPI003D12D658
MISEKLRFWALTYFAKNACPDRFSLSSEKAKSNDFYEVRVYFPTDRDRVLYQFMPDKGEQSRKDLIKGKKLLSGDVIENCFVSEAALENVRIDVIYYLGTWKLDEKHCTDLILIKMVIWRSLGLMRVNILYNKLSSKFNLWRVNKRLRSPLKSKFEIYESLMSSDRFLRTGTFRKSEVTKLILGGKQIGDFDLSRKFSQSLDWILDASIEDGEVVKVSHENDRDPLYKMKGKGIHYFTLTKEQIKNEEHNKQIQKSQVKIQNRMLFLTILLVVATFMTAVDKFDDTLAVVHTCWEWVARAYHAIKAT